MTRLQNASGSLTAYAFACGYMERADYGTTRYTVAITGSPFEVDHPRVIVTLQRDSACWRITLRDYATGEQQTVAETRLSAARRSFANMRAIAKATVAKG